MAPNKKSIFSGRVYQYSAALSASSAVLALGVNIGWSSPYIPYLLSSASPIPTTQSQGSWCAIAPLGGCLAGAFLGANMVDRIGRKRSLLLLAPVTFLSIFTMAFVPHVWYLSVLRFIIGMTDGAIFTVLPMYIGEIVDADIRVFLSSSLVYIFTAGNLLINVIGPLLTIFQSSLITSIFPALHFLTFIFMPESPYFLVKIKDYNEAEKSLRKLGDPFVAQEELETLKESVETETQLKSDPKISDLFTVPSNRKACLIFLILMFVNRASGKVPIMLHTTTIFNESGSKIDSHVSVIIYSTVELIVMIFVTLFVTKKCGKRPLIILSACGCSLSLFALATFFHLKHIESYVIKYLNWLPITSLVSYNILFSLGISYGPMSYLSELFPMNVKANAAFSAQVIGMVFSITFAQFFQITYAHFGIHIPFYFFALFTASCVIFIYKVVPETRGKTLEEIQNLLVESCKLVEEDLAIK